MATEPNPLYPDQPQPQPPSPAQVELAKRQLISNYVNSLTAVDQLLTDLLDSGKATAADASSWKAHRKAVRGDLHRARKKYLEVGLAACDELEAAVTQVFSSIVLPS